MFDWNRWLKRVKGIGGGNRRGAGRAGARKRGGPRLRIEQLEDRTVPSVLTTNKAGYAPTETAVFTGSGFTAGETIDVSVVNQTTGASYTALTVTVPSTTAGTYDIVVTSQGWTVTVSNGITVTT